MYCNGNCEHLDRKHKKCLLTGNKLCYMRVRGSISYDVYNILDFVKKTRRTRRSNGNEV